jgi:hypothetical protein
MPKAAMFNTRIKSVDTSGAFKDASQTTRCLVPADGFYEWTKSPSDGGKDPWHVDLSEHAPCSFAGLWEHTKMLGITGCSIITTSVDARSMTACGSCSTMRSAPVPSPSLEQVGMNPDQMVEFNGRTWGQRRFVGQANRMRCARHTTEFLNATGAFAQRQH